MSKIMKKKTNYDEKLIKSSSSKYWYREIAAINNRVQREGTDEEKKIYKQLIDFVHAPVKCPYCGEIIPTRLDADIVEVVWESHVIGRDRPLIPRGVHFERVYTETSYELIYRCQECTKIVHDIENNVIEKYIGYLIYGLSFIAFLIHSYILDWNFVYMLYLFGAYILGATLLCALVSIVSDKLLRRDATKGKPTFHEPTNEEIIECDAFAIDLKEVILNIPLKS